MRILPATWRLLVDLRSGLGALWRTYTYRNEYTARAPRIRQASTEFGPPPAARIADLTTGLTDAQIQRLAPVLRAGIRQMKVRP